MSRHNRGFSNRLAVGCVFAGLAILTGCGGGGSSTPPPPPPPPTLTITTTSLTDGVQSTAYSVTVQATGGTGTQTWSASGTLPDGLSFGTTGAITGTPTVAGTFNFMVTVVDQGTPQQSATQSLSIRINTALSSTPPPPPAGGTTGDLPGGSNDAVYNQTLTATGGVAPYTWSVTAGSLPPGLTIDSATGTISGTPTQGGTFTFTVQVQDSSNPPQTVSFALTIVILKIDTTSLLDGVTGAAYSQTVAASGGVAPLAWSGTLPGGFTIAAGTGVISGTPAAAGAFNFTVQVTDSSGTPLVDTQALSIRIADPLVITTTTLPDGNISVAYSQTVVASGGAAPLAWSISGGALPGGLTLDGGTGTISGTPTATGTFNFTVEATDSLNPAQLDTQALAIVITDLLLITTTTLSDGVTNVAYSQTVAATGGTTPYTFAISAGLHPDLTLDAATGVISGTPTGPGASTIDVTVTDSSNPVQTDTKTFDFDIVDPLNITTTTLPNEIAGTAYNQTVASTGGLAPLTWALATGSGPLPDGLTLNPTTGAISGTPTTPGPFNFTVEATDSSNPPQTDTQALSITIIEALQITTTGFNDGIVGLAYSQTAAATGGVTPYTWSISVGALPGWATLNAGTGEVIGTPNAIATTTFTLQIQDSGTPQQTKTLATSITVGAVLNITTTTLPDGTVGTAYNQTLTSTGGSGTITWNLASGSSLPADLTLASATGVISGIPTAAGTTNFTVESMDSSNPAQVVNQGLSITIADALNITTTTLPNGTVNTAYSQALAATGGTTPYSWSVTVGAGALSAAGLTLAADGTLSGTPTADGTLNFTVQAQDSSTPTPLTDTQALSLIINAAAPGARNDTIATATPLSDGRVAASISPYPAPGSVDKPDVDVYQITGTAGTIVTIEIFAMRLTPASPLDSMIQIVDANGVQLTTCRNQGDDDGVTGAPDATPLDFDDQCLNDDITLGVERDSQLELQVQTGTTTFFVRVLSWSGGARPDFLYEIEVTTVTPAPMSVTVDIPAILYSPGNVTIGQGGTVTWTNTDAGVQHSATSDDGVSFDTGVFDSGLQRTVTFNTIGSFPYHCIVHGFAMTGTVTVVAN